MSVSESRKEWLIKDRDEIRWAIEGLVTRVRQARDNGLEIPVEVDGELSKAYAHFQYTHIRKDAL